MLEFFWFLSAHKYSQAIDLYTQAIEINGQNAVYWANRAFAHVKLEEYGSAIQDATMAVEVDPRYSKARFARFNPQSLFESSYAMFTF